MRIQIRGRDSPVTDVLRTHVERRLGFALGRFGERVDRVTVQFSEANYPRGDGETWCRIQVGLRPFGSIGVEDTGADRFVATNGAAERASRSVARTLARERDENDGRPRPFGKRRFKSWSRVGAAD
jgi:putative sigma-54 modulation protein